MYITLRYILDHNISPQYIDWEYLSAESIECHGFSYPLTSHDFKRKQNHQVHWFA